MSRKFKLTMFVTLALIATNVGAIGLSYQARLTVDRDLQHYLVDNRKTEQTNLCNETQSRYPELAHVMQQSSYCARVNGAAR